MRSLIWVDRKLFEEQRFAFSRELKGEEEEEEEEEEEGSEEEEEGSEEEEEGETEYETTMDVTTKTEGNTLLSQLWSMSCCFIGQR